MQNILKQLSGSTDERLKAVQELAAYCNDPTFAAEFTEKKGVEELVGCVEKMEAGKLADQINAQLLPAFVDLMDHGLTQWDLFESTFIKKVAGLVNNQSNNTQDSRTLQAALSILESLVLNSAKYAVVDRELTIPNLAMHLQNPSPAIQQNALALINALFLKADDAKRTAIAGTLNTRQIRNSIVINIVQGTRETQSLTFRSSFHLPFCMYLVPAAASGNEMAHQLHVLQTLMLNVLEERMNRAIDPNDPDAHEKVRELRRIAFDGNDGGGTVDPSVKDVTTRHHNKTSPRDFRKLGFKNDTSPLNDFSRHIAIDFCNGKMI